MKALYKGGLTSKNSLWSYIKNYKFRSIFIKNFLVVLLLIMVPLAGLHVLVFRYIDGAMREEISRASLGELIRIRDSIDIVISEAERLSIRLGSNQDVEWLLSRKLIKSQQDYPTIQRIRRIQDQLQISTLTNPYIHKIMLYSRYNDYVVTASNAGSLDKFGHEWWYNEYNHQKNKDSLWFSTLKPPDGNVAEMTLFRYLFADTQPEREGLFMVSLGANELDPLLKEHTPAQEVYIVDKDGVVVYSPNFASSNERFEHIHPDLSEVLLGNTSSQVTQKDGKSYVITSAPSSGRGWTYILLVPLEKYTSIQGPLQSFIILLMTIGMLSSSIIAFIISLRTYQPIRRIMHLLDTNSFSLGEDKHTAPNELKYIAAAISHSIEQKEELEEELEKRYERTRKAQSIALQAQINPHMLYNTLEAVNWKVMSLTNGKNEASVMIHALSRLLRLSLATGHNVIPLRQELEHARLYVSVQQMHLFEELEVNWIINHNILDYMTVKLTLQPIIENAMYHGIKPSGRKGIVSIIGYEEVETIVLKIKDNGVGMNDMHSRKINRSFGSDEIKETQHIGLSNVDQRIKLIFGKKYGLKIRGKEGKGTIVEIRIPKIK